MATKIEEGYVEITMRDAAVTRGFSRLDSMMDRTSAKVGGLSKAFAMGLGVGSAEQAIRQTMQLIKLMDEAAEKGDSVGDAFARWAHELTGVKNAIIRMDEAQARSKAWETIDRNLRNRIDELNGKKPNRTEAELQPYRDKLDSLKAEIEGADKSQRYRTIKKWGIRAFAPILGASGEDDLDERLPGMKKDLERRRKELEQLRPELEKALRNEDAKQRAGYTSSLGFGKSLQEEILNKNTKAEQIAEKQLNELKAIKQGIVEQKRLGQNLLGGARF